jgi:RHS repeat-associated protein
VVAGTTVPTPLFLQGWTLDKVGNWTNLNNNGLPEARTHGANHQITARGAITPTYDADLNQIDDGWKYKYEYDILDQLERVLDRTTNAVVAEYVRDSFGRRVWVTDPDTGNGAWTCIYDGNRLVEMWDGGNDMSLSFTYGTYIDEVLTLRGVSGNFWYHQDRLFSVHALTDETGAVAERVSYTTYALTTTYDSAYANPQSYSRVRNPFHYTGRLLDPVTALYDHRARTYDPAEGRFKQRDPLGYVDGVGLYEYVQGRATSAVDPAGTTVAGRHHWNPLSMGGPQDGAISYLTQEQHTAAHKYLRDQGFGFTDEGKHAWACLDNDERRAHILKSAEAAGVDPNKVKKHLDKIAPNGLGQADYKANQRMYSKNPEAYRKYKNEFNAQKGKFTAGQKSAAAGLVALAAVGIIQMALDEDDISIKARTAMTAFKHGALYGHDELQNRTTFVMEMNDIFAGKMPFPDFSAEAMYDAAFKARRTKNPTIIMLELTGVSIGSFANGNE